MFERLKFKTTTLQSTMSQLIIIFNVKYVMLLHLERAAADLVSKPTMRLSMGTKIPPPPTPPTVPKAEPVKPIMVASTLLQLNFNSW